MQVDLGKTSKKGFKMTRNMALLALLLSSVGVCENRIANGDFEDGFRHWTAPYWAKLPEGGEIVEDIVYSGKRAWRFGNSAVKEMNYIVSETVKRDPEATYTLSLALRGENLQKDGVIARLFCRANGKILPFAMYDNGVNELIRAEGTFDWKVMKAVIKPSNFPKGTTDFQLMIYHQPNNVGQAWLDNVSLTSDRDVVMPEAARIVRESVSLSESPRQSATRLGVNLWPVDDSFEASSPIFPLPRSSEEAHHGKYSLVMGIGTERAGTRNLFRLLPPDVAHEFSFWAKSDRPGEFRFSSWSQDYHEIHNKRFEVGSEWRRYRVRYEPNKGWLSPTFSFSKDKNLVLWLDEFQVCEWDRGSASYTPGTSLSIGMDRLGTAGEFVAPSDERMVRRLTVRNNESKPRDVEVHCVLHRALGSSSDLFKEIVSLEGDSSRELELVVLDKCDVRGYYTIEMSARSGDASAMSQIPFVIIDEPMPATESGFSGMHSNGVLKSRRANVSWERQFRFWQWTGEKDGRYSIGDVEKDRREHGLRQFVTFKVSVPPDRYKIAGGWADPSEVTRYICDYVSQSPLTDHFEFENEPDLTFPGISGKELNAAADLYAEVVKTNAPILRKLKPGIKLAGAGVSGVDFNKGYPFLRRVLERAGEHLDILAVHPYSDARYVGADKSDIGPEANGVWRKTEELKQIIKEHGGKQSIWFGEIGWGLDVREGYQSESALRHGDYCARLLLLAKALGVEKVMYFLADAHIERQFYYYGIWCQDMPLPAAAAYAATSHLLEGATLEKIISNTDVHCFVFRHRDGQLFASMWNAGNQAATAQIGLRADDVKGYDMFYGTLDLKSDAQGIKVVLDGHPRHVMCGRGLDEGTFMSALSSMRLDLPPVSVSWRFANASQVVVRLDNLRMVSLNGKVRFRYGDRVEERILPELNPNSHCVFDFTTPDTFNGEKLDLLVETNLGEARSGYKVEMVSCPRVGTPGKALPDMDSRDYLLPNDPGNGWAGPGDLSVKSRVEYDDIYFHLHVDVRDDIHFQNNKPGQLWAADAIQVAFDPKADAIPNVFNFGRDDLEFGFGLTPDGPMKELTYIYETGRAEEALASVKFDITRSGDVTSYRVSFPWSTLGIVPAKGTIFGMNFTANDNDGAGNRFWMGLTPGIVEAKNPYAYRKFVLE